MGERNPQDLVLAREFLVELSGRLGLDPAIIADAMPYLLGMTKHVAHDVVRPAAPLAAFLVGVAAAQSAAAGGQLNARVLAEIETVEALVEEYRGGQA